MLIVTGGDLTRTKVSSYTITGWKSDFPDLNIGRSSHGCGFYLNDDMKRVRYELTYYVLTQVNVHILLSEIKTTNSNFFLLKVFLVAGGENSSPAILSSTEILIEGGQKWSLHSLLALPRPKSNLRGISVSNTILMTGIWDISFVKLKDPNNLCAFGL